MKMYQVIRHLGVDMEYGYPVQDSELAFQMAKTLSDRLDPYGYAFVREVEVEEEKKDAE